MTKTPTYRDWLRVELAARCSKNPQYSLRSFARALKLEPTHLSAVLNGKKGISRAVAASIARTTGMNPAEALLFCDLVESEHARSKSVRALAAERVKLQQLTTAPRGELSIDTFRAVSDWFHFALLQLMKLKDYRDDLAWIAHSLGITPLQAKGALERLERLELIEKHEGRYRPTGANVASPDGVPSEAIKKFHEQILEKASKALYCQSVDQRDITAEVLPIAVKDLPKAKRMIRDFRQALVRELTTAENLDEVYCLSVQLFGLTPGTSSEVENQVSKSEWEN